MGYPIFCCQSVATDFARGKRHDKQVPKSDDHIIREDFRMDKYIFDESNGLWYERCGDYYLPCLSLPERKPVGIWGQRYLRFLKEHRSTTYTAMLLNGTLDDHVAEIDRQAEEMLDRLTKQMAQHEGVTEALKARNQVAWVGAMNNIRARAEEVVRAELIYI